MPQQKPGHRTRNVHTHKQRSKKHRTYRHKSKMKPSKQQIKNQERDLLLSKKLLKNFVIESSRTKGPAFSNAKKLLELRNKSIRKGEFGKAVLYDTMATAYFFTYNPMAPTAVERGRLGEARTGIHGPSDPDTMVKWGTLPPVKETERLTRTERRRVNRRTRKGEGRSKKRTMRRGRGRRRRRRR